MSKCIIIFLSHSVYSVRVKMSINHGMVRGWEEPSGSSARQKVEEPRSETLHPGGRMQQREEG